MSKALVFVGGLGAPGHEWPLTPIRRSARERGWRTKYFNKRLIFGPLTTSAERLVDLVVDLRLTHNKVVVVGHSMGGLVAEHAAALGAPMDGIVTIGTPHQGNPLSRFTLWPLLRDMTTGSDYFKGVANIPGPRPPILAVAAEKDRLVSKSTARPTREHEFLVAKNCGHLGAIFDQDTTDAILEWANRLPIAEVPKRFSG